MKQKKIQILLVEGDDRERQILKRHIQQERLQFVVHEVFTVKEGISLLKKRAFDAVLFDYNPGAGFDLLRAAEETPVIFMVLSGDEDFALESSRSGVIDYLIKDENQHYLKMLDTTIKTAISRRKAELSLKEKNENFLWFFNVEDSLVFVVDENKCILQVNNSSLERLGYRETELTGSDLRLFVAEDERLKMDENIEDAFSGKEVVFSIHHLTKDDQKVSCETRLNKGTWNGQNIVFVFSKDLTALKATEDRFFKAFHSSSTVMIICTLYEGRVIEANESVYKTTGFSREEMIGKTITELNLYPDLRQRDELREFIRKQGYVKDHELTIRTKDGELRYGLFSVDLIEFDGQVSVLAVGSDFTERKKAEEELKFAYKELVEQKIIIEKKSSELENANRTIEEKASLLEEASRHKSDFIASMSHELRTPLNSIILLSELLTKNAKGKLSEKEIEYTTIIRSAGNDLLELVNDILDISKVESGRMDVNPAEMSLEYLKRKLGGYFSEVAAIKGLEFSIQVEGGLPGYIITDAQKLEQILKNLVSNAMKFTEEGTVILSMHRPESHVDLSMIGLEGLDVKKTVAFSVSDTGTGIPENKRDYIFETFRQADNPISSNQEGTGLGLPISKVLAQLLGGDIRIENINDAGNTFTVYIPESMLTPHAKNEEDTIVDYERPLELFNEEIGDVLSGKKILIADDDMRLIYSLIRSFEKYKPEIIVGANGYKALEKMTEHPDLDIVLLDIAISESNGYQVLRDIRKQAEFVQLPIVVMTAQVKPDDLENCLNAGATAYLTKPVDKETLLLTTARLIAGIE